MPNAKSKKVEPSAPVPTETLSEVLAPSLNGAAPSSPQRRLTAEDLVRGQQAQKSYFEELDAAADGPSEIRIATPPRDTPCILPPHDRFSLDARIIYPKDSDPILLWGGAVDAVKPEFGRPSHIELYAMRDGTLSLWLIKRPPQYEHEVSRYSSLRALYREHRARWFMFRWEQFEPQISYVSDAAARTAGLPAVDDIAFPDYTLADLLNDHFPLVVIDPNDPAIALYI